MPTIDQDIALALAALDAVLKVVGAIGAQKGLTADQIIAIADQADLDNKNAIRVMLSQP